MSKGNVDYSQAVVIKRMGEYLRKHHEKSYGNSDEVATLIKAIDECQGWCHGFTICNMAIFTKANTKRYAKHADTFRYHYSLYELIAKNEIDHINPAAMLAYIKGVYAIQTTDGTNGTQLERFRDIYGDCPLISGKMSKEKLATIIRKLMQSKKQNAIYLASGGCDYIGGHATMIRKKGKGIELLDPNESKGRPPAYKSAEQCVNSFWHNVGYRSPKPKRVTVAASAPVTPTRKMELACVNPFTSPISKSRTGQPMCQQEALWTDSDGNTALHRVAKNGNHESTIQQLIEVAPEAIQIANRDDLRPLSIALHRGNVSAIRQIMSAGETLDDVHNDMNYLDEINTRNGIEYAIRQGLNHDTDATINAATEISDNGKSAFCLKSIFQYIQGDSDKKDIYLQLIAQSESGLPLGLPKDQFNMHIEYDNDDSIVDLALSNENFIGAASLIHYGASIPAGLSESILRTILCAAERNGYSEGQQAIQSALTKATRQDNKENTPETTQAKLSDTGNSVLVPTARALQQSILTELNPS